MKKQNQRRKFALVAMQEPNPAVIDGGRASELGPGSESSSLRALGVQVCDATDVECRVVDSCDAKLKLASRSSQLAKIDRQIDVMRNQQPDSDALEQVLKDKDKLQNEMQELQEIARVDWGSQLEKRSHGSAFDLDSLDGMDPEFPVDKAKSLSFFCSYFLGICFVFSFCY